VWFYKPYDGKWTKKSTHDKFDGQRSIPQTIQSPTYFANTSNTQWQTNYGGEDRNDAPVNQLWGYTGVEGAWGDTFAKTMWDPCPVGYKVANHIVYNSGGLWNPNTGGVETYRFGNMAGGSYNQYGIWLANNMWVNGISNGNRITTDTGVWIPFAKMMNSAGNFVHTHPSGNQPNYSGALHSACPYSGNRIRALAYYYNGYLYTAHRNSTYVAAGAPVRCIKE
jgi:hypothetical protein